MLLQAGTAASIVQPPADEPDSRPLDDPAAAEDAGDDAPSAAAQGEAADEADSSAKEDAVEEDDELEAPSIPSDDDSDGDDEVCNFSTSLSCIPLHGDRRAKKLLSFHLVQL